MFDGIDIINYCLSPPKVPISSPTGESPLSPLVHSSPFHLPSTHSLLISFVISEQGFVIILYELLFLFGYIA